MMAPTRQSTNDRPHKLIGRCLASLIHSTAQDIGVLLFTESWTLTLREHLHTPKRVCTHARTRTHAHMHTHAQVHATYRSVRTGSHARTKYCINMYIDTFMDKYPDLCIDMCIDVCIDVCIDMRLDKWICLVAVGSVLRDEHRRADVLVPATRLPLWARTI